MSLLTVDGCHNYTVLSEADRAQEHIVINASNYRSDYTDLVPGWYRFQGAAGDRMADKCVPYGSLRHSNIQVGFLVHTRRSPKVRSFEEFVITTSNNCCY